MLSRASSLLMMAVLRESSIRSAEKPGHKVRMFQLEIRRGGVFVVFLLLTAWCKYLLSCREGPLNSMHPVEQASNDGAAPDWLGAAQFEAGGTKNNRTLYFTFPLHGL